ncbi:MAG: hypothetical protein JO112_01090 [Planctomycetes bacterium]|nr:hypothetical protein [Planctomycetota bacterium]
MKFELWHAFVLGAILSWGAYVPVLQEGQAQLGGNPGSRAIRAFLCVGIAYFITAIVVPVILMLTNVLPRDFQFTPRGTTFAVLGGIAGAAGALGIILAFMAGGKPLFIAPLVFAGAPIVATIVTFLWHQEGKPGAVFYVGLVLAAVGAALVLYSKGQMEMSKKAAAVKIEAPAQTPEPTRL